MGRSPRMERSELRHPHSVDFIKWGLAREEELMRQVGDFAAADAQLQAAVAEKARAEEDRNAEEEKSRDRYRKRFRSIGYSLVSGVVIGSLFGVGALERKEELQLVRALKEEQEASARKAPKAPCPTVGVMILLSAALVCGALLTRK